MKSNPLKKLALAVTMVTLYAFANAQMRAVNMVFTDADRIAAIDTNIMGTDESLEDLYASFNLKREDVHEIFLSDGSLTWVSEGEHVHEAIVIDHATDMGEHADGRKMKIIEINTDGEELTDEERAEIEQKIGHTIDINTHADGEEHKMMIQKHVVLDHTDQDGGEEDEVEIRVEIVDGVKTVSGTKNGVEMTEEEANEYVDAQNVQVLDGAVMERQMVFISEEEMHDGENVFIERRQFSQEGGERLAIAIIKEMEEAEINGVENARLQVNDAIRLFPNPADEFVQASFTGIEGPYVITVTNLMGQVMLQERGNATEGTAHRVITSKLAAGTYIMSVDHGAGLASSQFVVE